MYILPTFEIYYVLVFLFLFSFSSFVLIVFYWVFYNLRNKKYSRSADVDTTFDEALRIIDDARQQSMRMLEQGNIKAQEIISQAANFSDDIKQDFSNKLHHISKYQLKALQKINVELLSEYKDVAGNEHIVAEKAIEKLTSDLRNELSADIGAYADFLRKQITQTKEFLEDKTGAEYQKMYNEIKEYREQKFKEIDDKAFELIKILAKELLGKTMSNDEHRTYIMQLVSEIKLENPIQA